MKNKRSALNANADYRVAQKVIHWLMAILIIGDLYVAQKFGGVMTDVDRFESRSDHATIGTVVAVLFVLRIYLRIKHGAPPLPTAMPAWQKTASHIAHWGLYLLIGVLIATGILTAINANSVVSPFGRFPLSDGSGLESNFLFFRNIHEFITNTIIALIAIHIVGALYHGLIKRDGVMGRMARFWKSEKAVKRSNA